MHSHAKCQSCKMSVMQNVSHAKCAPQSGYEWEMCATRENNVKCASQQRSQWKMFATTEIHMENVRHNRDPNGICAPHHRSTWKMCATTELSMENVRHNSDPKGNLFLSDFPEKLFSTGWVPAFDRRVLDAIEKLKNSIFKIYTSVFFENGQHNFSYLNLGCVSDVALTDHGTVIVGIIEYSFDSPCRVRSDSD